LIALEGSVSHEASKRRGSGIRVYGVDERFWRFHGRSVAAPGDRDVFISQNLAEELGATTGDSLLLRVEKFSEIPIESLHSRKEDLGSTLRLDVRQILDNQALGEFSIQPQQTGVRAVFVSLQTLQKAIEQENKANLILISEAPSSGRREPSEQTITQLLKTQTTLQDFGIKLRQVEETIVLGRPSEKVLSLEHESRLITDSLANTVDETANSSSLIAIHVFSYLANSIRSGGRSIPYSLVSGVDAGVWETLRDL